ncbi:hypothetical protein U9M48_009916, partial [Paspalum notatum var. saurae]
MAAPPSAGARKRRRIAVGPADDYVELSPLGHGAFGAVLKARHVATGQDVAIKRLRPDADPSDVFREACFLEDACATGGGNPFVVGFRGVVRDFDQHPTTSEHRLVMEFVGPSLSDVLRRHRAPTPMPEASVRAAMRQLLAGAATLHAAGIVHRDIKPQNVLVDEARGVLKLCDFGIAMRASDPPPRDHVGTLWYKAPEMLLKKPDYDGARVDAWALGCVMAEIVSGDGRPLFGEGLLCEDQLISVLRVLGVPGDGDEWPWFSSTPFATEVMPQLDVLRRCGRSRLRELFPETKLSEEGFQVLSGLLTCNPEKRLTAADALKHPWFDKIDDDVLEQPQPAKKAAVPLVVRKRRKMHQVSASSATTTSTRFVMECVGPSLSDVLRQHRAARGPPPMPEASARAAMRQLLTGAGMMHARQTTPCTATSSSTSLKSSATFGIAMLSDTWELGCVRR